MSAENLYLHYVSDGPPRRRQTISRADLRDLITARRSAGRPPASLEAYRSGAPEADAFTLSFDDAHASVLAHAAPVLAELDMPATLFVPTAYVGASDAFLDWDDLRRLRDLGWTLGAHSHTHPRMSWRLHDEDDAAHLARLRDELARSRERFERELGEAPALFAYPYGEAPPVARRAAREAGFECAFTVAGDRAWDGDRLAIPRLDALETPPRQDAPTAFSVVVPAYDRVAILADVVGRLAGQSYPEDRYEVIVVDDGSPEALAPLFADGPSNVRVVRQGDDGFRAGQARQRGADEARHDHLVFLDADVAVDPDFLWHLDWVHRRIDDAVLLGYLSGYNLHDMGLIHRPADVIGADVRGLPIIPDRSREPTLRACLDNLDWLEDPWTLTYTGNLSLPKALFERVGGFSDDFVGWGLEDIDLGVRLQRGGGQFVFSRFAIGWHVVDPDETGWRNPFREREPTIERFAGYLTNLSILERRHPGDPAVQGYVTRSRADIDETCAKPMTVGIEMGGEARDRSTLHRRLHHVQPGGVPKHELLDRVAYAEKIGARTIYALGGEPAEHPDLLALLEAASRAVSWVSLQTMGHGFATPGLARDARSAGLNGAVIDTFTADAALHDALHSPGCHARWRKGVDALRDADLELSARLVVTPRTAPGLEGTRRLLEALGLGVSEVVWIDCSPRDFAHDLPNAVQHSRR
ncbi:MAG: polysaccharide deacetylase family protein [Myxococcota bacterium]|nr:polysaccharide deacetylase family protein [Myxococcota bacterium]